MNGKITYQPCFKPIKYPNGIGVIIVRLNGKFMGAIKKHITKELYCYQPHEIKAVSEWMFTIDEVKKFIEGDL